MSDQKFLCDQMLGSLARWLRMLGYDTYYAHQEIHDDQLLIIAKNQHRVLITRDKELLIRARKQNIPSISIITTDANSQIKQVTAHLKPDEQIILSRCLLCNTKLQQVDKEQIKGKVPDRIFSSHDLFWYCPSCDKIYWKGTHYQDMIHKIRQYQT